MAQEYGQCMQGKTFASIRRELESVDRTSHANRKSRQGNRTDLPKNQKRKSKANNNLNREILRKTNLNCENTFANLRQKET